MILVVADHASDSIVDVHDLKSRNHIAIDGTGFLAKGEELQDRAVTEVEEQADKGSFVGMWIKLWKFKQEMQGEFI